MTRSPDRPAFPDEQRSELDRVLAELMDTARKVLATQDRLRSLLQASQAVVEQLELSAVLRTIVEAAVDLVGARYGALGVIAPDGHLEQFIHVGISDELASRIGDLPRGRGLLGALVDDPRPIRTAHLGDDPRSVGFPPHHPAMDSFLGVPVRVRGDVFGNLYISEQTSGAFSDEDQDLLTALAATAGIAIENARLFDETKRRQRWSAGLAEVTASLLSTHADDSMSLIAHRVAFLADADLVSIARPMDDGKLVVDAASGDLADEVIGLAFPSAGALMGDALESGQPIIASDGHRDPEQADSRLVPGPAMVIPMVASGTAYGILAVARLAGRARFTRQDLEMAADFSSQVCVTLELARARADQNRLALLEDRSRIARDLHDNVIQRLFAAGLGLQAVAGGITDATIGAKIDAEVGALDKAIVEIRAAIFALTAPRTENSPSLRHRIIDVLGEVGTLFDTVPGLTFSGPVDLLTSPALADDLVVAVREGLTNVARHAHAHAPMVSLSIIDDEAILKISDDGHGARNSNRSSGLANLAARAEQWQGQSALTERDGGGSVLTWTARLRPARLADEEGV